MERCLCEATIFQLCGAGHIGIKRRTLWGVMSHVSFDPRAFMNGDPITFVKHMEGAVIEQPPSVSQAGAAE